MDNKYINPKKKQAQLIKKLSFNYGIPTPKERIEKDAQGVKFELEVTHCDEMDRIADFKKHFDKVNVYDAPLV